MSYRSLKRVLGESNLGRKLRWLFGACLLALIAAAFLLVYWIQLDLVRRSADRNGHEWVRNNLYDIHWKVWEKNPNFVGARDEISSQLLGQRPETHVIVFDPVFEPLLGAVSTQSTAAGAPPNRFWAAEDDEERALLESLRQQYEARIAEAAQQTAQALKESPAAKPIAPKLEDVFASRRRFDPNPASEEQRYFYYYYEPVNFRQTSCVRCHDRGMYGAYALPAADAQLSEAGLPFLVMRVTLPYDDYQAAINWVRAVLLSVAILTTAVSMAALWMVIRYVVLKPLANLRDTADAVTSGDLNQRAEIATNDEFEELADSFNKMLRHLIDAQSQLQAANQLHAAKVDELARLNMQLHEMNRLKGEFLANMSHELRTPLNSIIGFSELLADINALTDKQKRYAVNIQRSGRQLLDQVNDILDLAKLEAQRMELRLSEFRIDAVIHQQCELVRSLTEDKNLDLVIDLEPELPLMFQDQAKVQQILTNLLSNAIKFTPEGGRITVGAKGDPRGYIELFVADTGVGIPEAERETIFEKFRQGSSVAGRDNLTREYSGTGLGLSIVKELCKLLGGEVSVESELGKGSTFRVLIPWMRAESVATAARGASKLDELTRPRRTEFSEAAAVASDAG